MRVPGGLLLTGVLLAGGCGGSVVGGTADAGGGSGAVGTGASSAGGTGGHGAGGSATAGAGGSVTAGTGGTIGGPGYCTDATDLAAYKTSYPLSDGATGSIRDVAKDCTIVCLGDANPNQCTLSCIEQRTHHAFSTGCAQCFVDSMDCQIMNCLSDCLNAGAPCNACACANGCVAKTVQCTGIPDKTCSGG